MRVFPTLLWVFTVLFCAPAGAGQALPPSVQKAQEYLQTLSTAQARFLQTAQDGSQVLGTFYLNRPGKLRFEYDPPVQDFVVADGAFIFFYDGQMKEQSNAPIGQTLADFLLRRDLRLDGDIKVSNVASNGGLLQITLVQAEDPGAGSLTLGFEENPMKLKKWRVTDATGNITEIELFQMQTGIALAGDLFTYHDPETGAPRYNQ